MKKIYVVFCMLIVVIFASCTTVIFDESVPLEESVTLNINNGLTVTSYNGIDVLMEKPGMYELGWGSIKFVIPAGYAELLFNLNILESGGGIYASYTYTATDIPVNYNLKPGHTYDIYFSYINEEGRVPIIGIGAGVKRALLVIDKDQEDWRTPTYFVELDFK